MKDKATFRLIAVKYLDSYRTTIQSGSKTLAPYIEKLNSYGIKEIEIKDIFWGDILLSISGDIKHDYEVQNISIDWDTINLDIRKLRKYISDYVKENYKTKNQESRLSSMEDKENFIKRRKEELIRGENNSDINAYIEEFLFILLKNTWEIIMEYLPLNEYGYPQRHIFISIANHLCDNGKLELLNKKPTVKESMYRNILELKLENQILREYMLENNIYPELVLLNKDYYNSSILVHEISKKNEDYIIMISPYIKKTNLKDKYGSSIEMGISQLNKIKEIEELRSEQKDIEGKSFMFIDKRFNKGYGSKKILQELLKEAEELKRKDNKNDYEVYLIDYFKNSTTGATRIENDLKTLSQQTGLVELNNFINKRNLKRRGSSKGKDKK